MSKNNKSLELFAIVAESVDRIGIDKTIETLKLANKNYKNNDEEVVEFLIFSICKNYSTTRNHLLNSNTKSVRLEALGILYHFMMKKLVYSQNDISKYFQKSPSNISRALDKIKDLNPSNHVHSKIIEVKKKIEEEYNQKFKK